MDAVRRLLALVGVVLLAACSKPDRFADGWEKGGKLHDASLGDWAFATDANRQASSADFVREHFPGFPQEALPLTGAIIEKCLSGNSQRAASARLAMSCTSASSMLCKKYLVDGC